MKNKKALYLGGMAVGALLVVGVLAGPVVARSVGWLYGEGLRIANPYEQSSGTPDVTLAAGGAYIQGALEVDGAARFDGAFTANSELTASSRLITTKTQVGSQTGYGGIFASTTIPVTSSYEVLLGSGTDDTVLSSTPQIATTTVSGGDTKWTSGTYLTLTSTSTNGVVFCDEGTCTGSRLQLGAATRTVDQYDVLMLVWDSADGYWREVSFTAN